MNFIDLNRQMRSEMVTVLNPSQAFDASVFNALPQPGLPKSGSDDLPSALPSVGSNSLSPQIIAQILATNGQLTEEGLIGDIDSQRLAENRRMARYAIARQFRIQKEYGPDDRRGVRADYTLRPGPPGTQEVRKPTDLAQVSNAIAIVAPKSCVAIQPDGSGMIATKPLQEWWKGRPFCPTQPYRFDPSIGPGAATAWLGAADRVVTAGHVMRDAVISLQGFYLIFGFKFVGDGPQATTHVPKEAIYTSVRTNPTVAQLARRVDDWVVVHLDRPAVMPGGARRVPLETTPALPSEGMEVYLVGHPNGLPQTVIGNAKVLRGPVRDLFRANLDCMKGTSGGPVIGPDGKVYGLLYGSDRNVIDAEEVQLAGENCWVSKRYQDDGIVGERCTPSSIFRGALTS